MKKSAEAFRTISEVSELLSTPAHVLRFWESRFSQVKPVKRAGGRRYYRPNDLALLGGIKRLLHEDGLTIRGVQKLLREEGVKHVASLSKIALPGEDEALETEPKGTQKVSANQTSDTSPSWPEAPSPEAASSDDALVPDPDDVPAGVEQQPEPVAQMPGPRVLPSVAPGAERRAAIERHASPSEAPMDVDVPTLPTDRTDNVRAFRSDQATFEFDDGVGANATADATEGSDADSAGEVRQPAAAMLRAMDTLRARDNKAELMSVYLRLVDLRDRLARDGDRNG